WTLYTRAAMSERPDCLSMRLTCCGRSRQARYPGVEPTSMQRLNRQAEDSLSKLLRVVNVHSTVYCLSDFRAPWGFHVDESAVAKFHMVLDGRGVLELDSGERLNLEPGELVVLPLGSGHSVRNKYRATSVPSLDAILEENPPALGRLRHGGRGRRTRLLCGGFSLT